MVKTIQSEGIIAAERDLVWLAWTENDRITKWFAPAATIDAQEGGAFELFFVPSNREIMNTKGCTFLQVEPKKRLSFTWKGPDDFADLMNREDSLTQVTVTFEERDDQTSVVVQHSGWGEGEDWDKAYAWHQMAWKQVLGSLQAAFETGEGELCCSPQTESK